MDAMEAILTRRSIRRFTDESVSEDLIESVLRAAMAAPSAGNEQPWEFIVIQERPMLNRIPDAHPHAQMAAGAPLAIVVCGNSNREKYPGFWVQDCSAAVQNLLLAAHANDLGAVWCGIYPDIERQGGVRTLLSIPESVTPLALVVIGHPDEEKLRADRYDPSRVHRDGWSD